MLYPFELRALRCTVYSIRKWSAPKPGLARARKPPLDLLQSVEKCDEADSIDASNDERRGAAVFRNDAANETKMGSLFWKKLSGQARGTH
jgi:hypothetical protein